MKDKGKAKKQAVNKLAEFHQRINELERMEAERKRALERGLRMDELRKEVDGLIREYSARNS